MIGRRSTFARIAQVEIPVLLIVCFALAPYVWMILTSIKPAAELAEWPVRYLPRDATLQHYRELITRTSFAGSLLNSLIIASGAALALILTVLLFAVVWAYVRRSSRELGR